MGEPNQAFKASVQASLLAEKVAKAENERKKKIAELERKKLMEEKKKKAEEARRARLIAQGKEVPEEKEADAPMEELPEEVPVELTEEEKKITFRKSTIPDIAPQTFSKVYSKFELPSKDEGFDSIRYEWQKESECREVLKKYVLSQKMTQRAEDLQPSEWFKEQWSAWQKQLTDWKRRQTEWKDPNKKKALLAKKAAAEKKEGEEAPEPMKIDFEDLDVFAVEDVMDVGDGQPLFSQFVYEDWTLLSTRYEFFLLLHAFKKDLNDPDRPSFHESHLGYYYNKYFKKSFGYQTVGVTSIQALVKLIKEVLTVDESLMLGGKLPEDTPVKNFVQMAEHHRRDRQRRVDAGDETALLKFTRQAPQQPAGAPRQAPQGGYAPQKRPWTPAPHAAQSGGAWKQARPAYMPAFRR
jgi:hypothetical protein